VEWILEHPAITGPVNVAAPNPLTNRDMMATFRKVYKQPIGLPATRWMLEIGAFLMRTETELMIKSRRVVPGKLLESGFQFRFPTLQDSLEELERHV
jgi:NAD dependent epimerase/dehydratase family enzyme